VATSFNGGYLVTEGLFPVAVCGKLETNIRAGSASTVALWEEDLDRMNGSCIPTMSQMIRMQQLTIINIMLKYVLDQANNMPKMKLRVNFAKDNNQKTGVAAGAAQG
jgi:hypothetical protein